MISLVSWSKPFQPFFCRQVTMKTFLLSPGPILEIGNTNSRYRFSIGARRFVENWNAHGPAHHCAVGVGHVGSKIDKLGKLLGMEVARVC
jgi:L-arabinose isomerase